MRKADALRAQILDAAEALLQAGGGAALTQAKVAAAAGLRQSHLQYYFPRRLDLVAGLLSRHVEMSHAHGHAHGEIEAALALIFDDPGRMRFFLGIVAEADREPSLRGLLTAHLSQIQARVAAAFGRAPDDAAVEAYLNALRGYGMIAFATGERARVDAAELAAVFGLEKKKR